MKLVYMGTARFSVAPLRSLLDNQFTVSLVVTEPVDYETGEKSPAASFAEENGLPLAVVKDREELAALGDRLRSLSPDAAVVCAFGLILPPELLTIPQFGCFGIHASLLPRWRGIAPIDHTILAGDLQTGITIFAMTEKADCGDIIARMPCTAAGKQRDVLYDELSGIAAGFIVYVLSAIYSVIRLIPQEEALATYAPRIG